MKNLHEKFTWKIYMKKLKKEIPNGRSHSEIVDKYKDGDAVIVRNIIDGIIITSDSIMSNNNSYHVTNGNH